MKYSCLRYGTSQMEEFGFMSSTILLWEKGIDKWIRKLGRPSLDYTNPFDRYQPIEQEFYYGEREYFHMLLFFLWC